MEEDDYFKGKKEGLKIGAEASNGQQYPLPYGTPFGKCIQLGKGY